ncbi:MAG: hypothetical protein AAF961_12620 [Planctomycetota bacterium]
MAANSSRRWLCGESRRKGAATESFPSFSSWETANIGDIAATLGALRFLETYLPEVELTLWPYRVDYGEHLYDVGRPIPVTDRGQPLRPLLA